MDLWRFVFAHGRPVLPYDRRARGVVPSRMVNPGRGGGGGRPNLSCDLTYDTTATRLRAEFEREGGSNIGADEVARIRVQ